ncbi:MAG: hypothetical protein ISN28_11380 [Ectothiorhodospiraceae bacterium AqS1]|nr:hypothetical protein [Ectothiorhodospiraceae bacterium AqS1]
MNTSNISYNIAGVMAIIAATLFAPSVFAQSVTDRLNDTQVAWGDYCGNGCADVDIWDYQDCKSYCNSNNRADAGVADRLNDTQVAWGDYCGNGCADVDIWDYQDCKSYCNSNNRADAGVADRLNDTQVAWGDYCGNGCADVDIWDYQDCKSYCNSNNRAAWGDYCGNGCADVDIWDYQDCKSYCNSNNRADSGDTQVANAGGISCAGDGTCEGAVNEFFGPAGEMKTALTIEPEKPVCDTDAFSCFYFARPSGAATKQTQHAFVTP